MSRTLLAADPTSTRGRTRLTVVVLVAAAAGPLSSLLPSRRAARTPPAAGLAPD